MVKEKKRQSTEKKRGDELRGFSANVSPRHKRRKLPTSLFLIVEEPFTCSSPLFLLLGSSSFPLCILWILIYLCGLQMLDPAVRLPGHMDLQLFAWTYCFASKQTLKGCSSILTLERVVVFFSFRRCHMLGEMPPHTVW